MRCLSLFSALGQERKKKILTFSLSAVESDIILLIFSVMERTDIPCVQVIAKIPRPDRQEKGEDAFEKVLCTIRHFSQKSLLAMLMEEEDQTKKVLSAVPAGKSIQDSILISLDQISLIVPETSAEHI